MCECGSVKSTRCNLPVLSTREFHTHFGTPMPQRRREDRASDDVPDADDVRAMLKDLREARQSKIAQGLSMINPYHLEVSQSQPGKLQRVF